MHEHTPVPWYKSYKDITEYTSSFLDLYFTDYDRYLEIIMSKEPYDNYKKTKIKSISGNSGGLFPFAGTITLLSFLYAIFNLPRSSIRSF